MDNRLIDQVVVRLRPDDAAVLRELAAAEHTTAAALARRLLLERLRTDPRPEAS